MRTVHVRTSYQRDFCTFYFCKQLSITGNVLRVVVLYLRDFYSGVKEIQKSYMNDECFMYAYICMYVCMYDVCTSMSCM